MHMIESFEAFRQIVGGPLAVQVGGEVFPFRWREPSLREVIAQAREEPQARIRAGTRGDGLAQSLAEYAGDFQALPLDDAVRAPVHLSLFDLGRLRREEGVLRHVIDELYLPLTQLWAEHGLHWQRVYPILFLSGPGCSTNYHWDPSSVLIVQLSGRKRYYALNDPRRWLPLEQAKPGQEGIAAMVRPAGLEDQDIRAFDLEPGDAVWSPCLAPHWVDADDEPAFTLSIAFRDIAAEPSAERSMVVV
jgi:cupin superfamily protein